MRRLASLALVLSAGCSAYDYDLGDSPYLCGSESPRCPAGYSCVEDPNTADEVCLSDNVDVAFQCADDSALEPNDTLTKAMATQLDGSSSYMKDGLAICPATDKDTFAIKLTSKTKIAVHVTFDRGAPLKGAILNAGGVPLMTGTIDTVARTLDAQVGGLSPGTYHVQLSSTNTHTNNYAITISAQ